MKTDKNIEDMTIDEILDELPSEIICRDPEDGLPVKYRLIMRMEKRESKDIGRYNWFHVEYVATDIFYADTYKFDSVTASTLKECLAELLESVRNFPHTYRNNTFTPVRANEEY